LKLDGRSFSWIREPMKRRPASISWMDAPMKLIEGSASTKDAALVQEARGHPEEG